MEPFIKWAGGKRWLVKKHTFLLPKKDEFKNYIEPFLGGGSIFFHLLPNEGILNDINYELITTYTGIKNNWMEIQRELMKLNNIHSEELFYNIRNQRPLTETEVAIRFLYLNRTCWNGLYRVNKKNEFNVPIGTKTKIILDSDDFQKTSELLSKMTLSSEDFEKIILKSKKNDFLFIDPPYTVKHNNNGFIKYNENLFTWDDQIRLRNSVIKAVERGTKVLILNADHESIRDLYKGIGEFHTLSRFSVISGKSENRGCYNELAIKCF